MKKALSIALLTSVLLSSFSCGGESVPDETTALSADTTTEAVETEISDDLPEIDYEGAAFTMFVRDDDSFIADMYVESTTGDIMNDAV